LNAERDYRKSNKKTGVFPIDWLIFENLDHIVGLKYENQSKKQEVTNRVLIFCRFLKLFTALLKKKLTTERHSNSSLKKIKLIIKLI